MNNFNFGKFFSFLAFLAFAAVSCWATAESLYLSIDLDPTVCYVISIGFFVVASIGTVLIVKGLDSNTSLQSPGLAVAGGIFMVLAFWLLCSMPTNTHTFVYRDKVDKIVDEDIDKTILYLDQLKNNSFQEKDILAAQQKYETDVTAAFENLKSEIRNSGNKGFGPVARQKLTDLSVVLGYPIAELSTTAPWTPEKCERLINDYYIQVNNVLARKKQAIREKVMTETNANPEAIRQDASNKIAKLKWIKDCLHSDSIHFDYCNRERMQKDVNAPLRDSYTMIGGHQEFITFYSLDDRYSYTRNDIVTKVDGITEVFKVWKDILSGKYNGHGLWYWIVLAILVDIAAFIFFDIAFARSDED